MDVVSQGGLKEMGSVRWSQTYRLPWLWHEVCRTPSLVLKGVTLSFQLAYLQIDTASATDFHAVIPWNSG